MFGAGELRIARSSALGARQVKSPLRSPGVNERCPGCALFGGKADPDVTDFGASPGELRDASLTSCRGGLYPRCLKGNALPLPILLQPNNGHANICCLRLAINRHFDIAAPVVYPRIPVHTNVLFGDINGAVL